MNASRLVGVLLLLLVLQGCVKPLPPSPAGPLPSSTQLLELLDRQAHSTHSLKGLARVRLETPEREQAFSQVLLLERPDRLRAEVLGLFGQPALILVCSGEELTVAVPGSGRFYRGVASADNLMRFTSLPLEPHQLVGLLAGDLPRMSQGSATVAATREGVMLQLQGGGAVQRFDFDPQLRLVGASYRQGEEEWLRLGYGDFDTAGFPLQMSLTLPDVGVSAALSFSDLTVNPALAADRFVLSVPAGAIVQPLP